MLQHLPVVRVSTSPVLLMRVPIDARYPVNIMNSTPLQPQSRTSLESKLCGQPTLGPRLFIPSSHFEAGNPLSAGSSLQAESLPCSRKSVIQSTGFSLSSSGSKSWLFCFVAKPQFPRCQMKMKVLPPHSYQAFNVSAQVRYLVRSLAAYKLNLSGSLSLSLPPNPSVFLPLILSHSPSFFPQRNEIKVESSLRSQTYDTISGKSRTFWGRS